jgi:hypothetical protein
MMERHDGGTHPKSDRGTGAGFCAWALTSILHGASWPTQVPDFKNSESQCGTGVGFCSWALTSFLHAVIRPTRMSDCGARNDSEAPVLGLKVIRISEGRGVVVVGQSDECGKCTNIGKAPVVQTWKNMSTQ